MFEDMQLGDWTQLSGLTHLALRQIKECHHGTLVAVLPRMTALKSLILGSDKFCPWLPAAGGRCPCHRAMLCSVIRLSNL